MEGSADETRRVEAASSNPSVESPPRSRTRWETMPDEAEAEDTRRSVARKAAQMGVAEVPHALPSPLPQETPSRELFPARQGPILPGIQVGGGAPGRRAPCSGIGRGRMASLACVFVCVVLNFELIALFLLGTGWPEPAGRQEDAGGTGHGRPS